jgi:hypothetical protein
MLYWPVELTSLETAPVSTPTATPNAPPRAPPFAIPSHLLRRMVLTLPRPPADAPETAWQAEVQGGLDTISVLDPRNALEATLVVHFIALTAAATDACRIAFEADASSAQALRQRACAASLTRAMSGINRLLEARRKAPAGVPRDWGDTAVELTAGWRAAPARPAEVGREETEDEPEEITRWIDEIDDAELKVAIEQERRETAGEPELPRAPGQPKVRYRYKPDDYIHKFKPDPRAKRPYPGWENMTMAERREYFGYTYTGPGGPPEALTSASRDAMLVELAAEALLRDEYGM